VKKFVFACISGSEDRAQFILHLGGGWKWSGSRSSRYRHGTPWIGGSVVAEQFWTLWIRDKSLVPGQNQTNIPQFCSPLYNTYTEYTTPTQSFFEILFNNILYYTTGTQVVLSYQVHRQKLCKHFSSGRQTRSVRKDVIKLTSRKKEMRLRASLTGLQWSVVAGLGHMLMDPVSSQKAENLRSWATLSFSRKVLLCRSNTRQCFDTGA